MKDAAFSSARLLALYDRISDAEDAIPRLRRLVLDLAVRGKLVEQDAHDKPEDFTPSDRSGKTLGSRASSKKVPPSVEPYSLPKMWKWVEIGDQLDLLNGMAFKPSDWAPDGLRIVRIQNLNRQDAPFNYCDPNFARERSLIDDGSFLISWSGTPGTSFGAFIWDRGPAVLNQHIFRCDFKTEAFTTNYLRLAINGRLDEMIEKAHGGVGLQHITKGKLEAMLIGLPPLAEQHRIVAKVEELMVLCDQLEQARAGREAVRDRLTTASLARLTAPDTDASAFQSHARFALQSLPTFTTRPDQIKTLRQTLLNLAVQGKLVEQNSTDESGEQLLDQIRELKEENVEPLELKRSAKFFCGKDGLPFELPLGWSITTLRQICYNLGDGLHGTPEYITAGNIYFINGTNLRNGKIVLLPNTKRVSQEEFEKHAKPLSERTLLVSINGTLTNYAFYNGERVLLGKSACYFEISPLMDMQFVRILIQTPYYIDYAIKQATGATIKNLSLKAMNSLPVPIPPLAEQHRIVAKVDALMSLCDQLETSLTTTATTRSKLLNALLHEALEPATETTDL